MAMTKPKMSKKKEMEGKKGDVKQDKKMVKKMVKKRI